MLFYPLYNPYLYRSVVMPSYVRILHASPDAPAVDIYANGRLIARNIKYKEFTPYLLLPATRYSILVYPTGTQTNPVINTSLDVMPGSSYTVAATGMLRNIQLLVVADTVSPLPANKTQIKFVHLSPNAPPVDLTLGDGTILFRNVEFKETTPNHIINPGNLTFQARLAGTSQVILHVPNQVLQPNRYYTIYLVGLAGGNPPLQMLTALDKASY